jgi:N-acetylmuramoyl-L-alanine amidase
MRPITTSRARRLSRRIPWVHLVGCIWLATALSARAAEVQVQRVRHYSAPEYTRIVLDLSRAAAFEVRELHDPDRLVVNVAGARFTSASAITVGDGLVKALRRDQSDSRAQVVLDLAYAARHESFSLPAGEGRPPRIVLDVFRKAGDDARREPPAPAAPKPVERALAEPAPASPSSPPVAERPAEPTLVAPPFRVILDPGHGGMDPGAIRGKVREKDVALAVCLELKTLLDAQPGIVTVLTRSKDYYPSLSRRVEIAREQEGDLFLSVHCNSHPKPTVCGMEVYFLSLQGASDREAQELADAENAADLVGLAPGEAQGDAVLSILMDLRMTQVLQQSSRLAESILKTTGEAGLGSRRVKQARFQVLRTLAMPAALVELAYLTHPGDRALLASREGQRRFAAALAGGILRFRDDRDVPAVQFARTSQPKPGADDWRRKYKVRRGDSLWDLAQRHGVTMDEIARQNNLRDRSLRIGQSLRLPGE